MSAIDAHTHAFPDDLAGRAIASLQEQAEWKAVGKGTVSDLIASMDAADIDLSVICTIATKPDQVKGILKWCKKIRSDRLDPFPSVHPATPKAPDWIARFAGEGFSGIKLHPMYQDFEADDPRMDSIYEAAAKHGIVVAFHAGRDIAFPDDDDRAAPRRLRSVIDRHPNLTAICTHLGGWRDWEQAERHLVGTRAYLETSFTLEHLGPERMAELIRRHGAERVLLGSDWPWASQADSAKAVRSLRLPKQQMRGILFGNTARLLRY